MLRPSCGPDPIPALSRPVTWNHFSLASRASNACRPGSRSPLHAIGRTDTERLLLEPNDKDKHARSLIARKGASAIQSLLKKWASCRQSLDVDAAAVLLWEFLTDETHILRRLKIRSRNDEEIGIEVWQIDAGNGHGPDAERPATPGKLLAASRSSRT